MKKTVAIVKLAPGNSGFFDSLTGLHLSLGNSIGYVCDNDDTTNIRRALKDNKLILTGGALPPVNALDPVKEVAVLNKTKKEIKEERAKEKKLTLQKIENINRQKNKKNKTEKEIKKINTDTVEEE